MFELEREGVILHIPQEKRGQYRNAFGAHLLCWLFHCLAKEAFI